MSSNLSEFRMLDSFNANRTYRMSDRVISWLGAIVDEYSADTPVVGVLNLVRAMLFIDAINFSKAGYTLIMLARNINSDELDDRESFVRHSFNRIGMRFTFQRNLYGDRFFVVTAEDFMRGFYRSMLLYRQITKFANPVLISNIIQKQELNIPYYDH